MDLTLAAELRPEGGIALHAHPEAPLVAPEEGLETLFRGHLGAASDTRLGDDAFLVGDARLYRPAEVSPKSFARSRSPGASPPSFSRSISSRCSPSRSRAPRRR